MFAIFWISKKFGNIQQRSNARSSVVGTENRNFNPILAIPTLWTLLSPTLCKCKLFCSSTHSVLSRPPLTNSSRRQSLCKKHTAVCRKVNILRIFRRFWRFSKKTTYVGKNSCITVLWQKSHWFPVCSRNQLKLLAEDLHLIWNRLFSWKDKRQGQRRNMQGLSCDLVASSQHVLCKATLLSCPLLD